MIVCVRIFAFKANAVPTTALCCVAGEPEHEKTCMCPEQTHFSPVVFDSLMAESAGVDLKDTGMAEQ